MRTIYIIIAKRMYTVKILLCNGLSCRSGGGGCGNAGRLLRAFCRAKGRESAVKNDPIAKREHIPTPPEREVEELASFTECTGLIPAGVPTEEEAEALARLYGVHPIKPNHITADGIPQREKAGQAGGKGSR